MTTEVFLGDLGSGKTTMSVRKTILTKQLHPEKKIYSNVKLFNYEYEELDIMDLYLYHNDEENIIVLADELYTMLDARVSTSYRNRIESYFVAMTRKANCDFFATMQYEKFVDLRFAPFVKVKYIMQAIPVIKTIVLNGVTYQYQDTHPYLFDVHLIDARFNGFMPIEKDFRFNGSRWFKEFETKQRILPPQDIIVNIEINEMKKQIQHAKLSQQIQELKKGVPINEVVKRAKKKKKNNNKN